MTPPNLTSRARTLIVSLLIANRTCMISVHGSHSLSSSRPERHYPHTRKSSLAGRGEGKTIIYTKNKNKNIGSDTWKESKPFSLAIEAVFPWQSEPFPLAEHLGLWGNTGRERSVVEERPAYHFPYFFSFLLFFLFFSFSLFIFLWGGGCAIIGNVPFLSTCMNLCKKRVANIEILLHSHAIVISSESDNWMYKKIQENERINRTGNWKINR